MKEANIQELITRYYRGKYSREDIDRLEQLLDAKDPSVQAALERLWEQEDDTQSSAPNDLNHILHKIHHRINLNTYTSERRRITPQRTTRWLNPALKIAAVVLFGIMVWLAASNLKREEPQIFTMLSPPGSVSQALLPDSSRVFLNAGSQISYTATAHGDRELTLTGEAWFDVSKMKERPFIVKTPFYSIKVLGTRFNVHAYPKENQIVTTLEEGSIVILSSGNLKLSNPIRLNPGDQFTYDVKNKTMNVKQVSSELYSSWKENKVVFINLNLKELMNKLERRYGVHIVVEDPSLLKYHYDGTIKNETIHEVLDLLKETLPITYEFTGDSIIIRRQ